MKDYQVTLNKLNTQHEGHEYLSKTKINGSSKPTSIINELTIPNKKSLDR